MAKMQNAGGVAALFEAGAFVLGFWIYFALLGPARYGASDVAAVEHVAFLARNQALLSAWNLVIYIAFGAALVVLALALHERVRAEATSLVSLATAFGVIWAGLVIATGMVANVGMGMIVDLYARDPVQAATVWQSYKFVVSGLGGGNEIVGGLWVLLVSAASLRSGGLPRSLGYLGLVIGGAGLLTTIPPLGSLGMVFGLGLIVWFVWVGAVLLLDRQADTRVVE